MCFSSLNPESLHTKNFQKNSIGQKLGKVKNNEICMTLTMSKIIKMDMTEKFEKLKSPIYAKFRWDFI
jgi:hypothetical protein